MGRLFVVATPIGNLEDITLRALRILGEVGLIAAEDTRRTRQLLTHFDIHTPLASYHEHSAPGKQAKILQALHSGDVALVSDAGTPGLNDPGYPLIQQAIEAGHMVVPIPGPSAPVAALTASGLPTDGFVFLGYIPRKQNERRNLFELLQNELRSAIAFEVPNRLLETLELMLEVLGPERKIVLGRELTKLHEEFIRGSLVEVVNQLRTEGARGEYTLVLGGAAAPERWQEEEVRLAFLGELDSGSSRADAAKAVAGLSGWSRRQIYRIGLEELMKSR